MSTFKFPDLRARQVDITLLLEGTYPYIRGGVSSWVHQLIHAFPEYTFALVFIGGHPDDYGEMCYELPKHVVHLETHFVHLHTHRPPGKGIKGNPDFFHCIKEFHEVIRTGSLQGGA